MATPWRRAEIKWKWQIISRSLSSCQWEVNYVTGTTTLPCSLLLPQESFAFFFSATHCRTSTAYALIRSFLQWGNFCVSGARSPMGWAMSWPQASGYPPASTFRALGLQVWVTMIGWSKVCVKADLVAVLANYVWGIWVYPQHWKTNKQTN